MMMACAVLPVLLFAFASWLNYRHENAVADDRIERSLDILHEHTLKVFQTVERAIAEVDEIVRGMPDNAVRQNQPRLHERLKQIVDALPQLRAIFLIDRDGRPIVSSQLAQVPADFNVGDRDFFQAQAAGHAGTYVSDVHTPRLTGFGTPFFVLSRRRPSADGSFNGVVAVAVLPRYFEDFYSLIGRSPGSFFALVQADGKFLARYPALRSRPPGLAVGSALQQAMAQARERVVYTIPDSEIDGAAYRVGFRKLEGFPVDVVAGIDSSAIRGEWHATMASHLIFGLPATLLLLIIIGVALRRTRRLYVEAERREAAEAALRQAQRLEAIGQLTGGVAHDFNNLLMIVSGSAQRLPAFREMLDRSLRGDIATAVAVAGEGCAVKVDPSEFELALLNLAVNARDAMPNGGSLDITAKPVVLDGNAAAEGLQGEFVAIRVADTGNGISPDVLPHVFEPFFTTKDVGKGTGLGLSQVYGFAKQSGGTATVTSIVGRGTVVMLYLPRTRELPAVAAAHPEPESAPARAGTVLLVEDNAEVAEVGTAYLQQLGYMVKQVASAHEALELLGNDPKIDLVFADILMPGGMTGLELGRAIRQRYHGMPVLLATGYSDSARDAVQQGFVVLQKPFDLAALEQGLRDAQKHKFEPVDPKRAAS